MRFVPLSALFMVLMTEPLLGQQLTPAAAANIWLSKECSLEDRQNLSAEVSGLGPTIEPYFIDAVNSGPMSSAIKSAQTAAQGMFDETTALITSGETFGLNPSYLSILSGESRDEFVTGYVNDFVLSYRISGITGLVLVAGPNGKKLLQSLANDSSSPLHNVAQAALQKLTGNAPPIASAGAKQILECAGHTGTSVTLDGSGSSDPAGEPLTFLWKDHAGNVIGETPIVK